VKSVRRSGAQPSATDGAETAKMPTTHSVAQLATHRTAAFYDWAHWLYPVVDCLFAPGRCRLIGQINQLPAGSLLEVGVGPGRHLGLYRKHHITAIDCSAKMVSSSRRYSPRADIRQMDGEALNFPDASFDYLALYHVLSVTADPARMLAEAHRVLRPGGRLFVLNHETPSNAWRYLDRMLSPWARGLRFRSWFRLGDILGIDRFRSKRLEARGACGLIHAYSFEK
jgi:phosphatidylethanolamine/phosphatidyl-N-methylethanolamine N-methyltransferase